MKLRYLRFFAPFAALWIALAAVLLPLGSAAFAQETGSNWQGNYWDNQSFSGSQKLTRTDAAIAFNWGGGSPDPSIPADHFSVRWVNTITFAAGTFRFRAGADDGIRVALDGTLIINRFTNAGGFAVTTADVPVTAGSPKILVGYYEDSGSARGRFLLC